MVALCDKPAGWINTTLLFFAVAVGTTAHAKPMAKLGEMVSQNEQTVLDRLALQLAGMSSMQADFVQTTRIKKNKNTPIKIGQAFRNNPESQVFSGVMAVKRPGFFRWQTEQPMKQLIVASQQTVWVYDEDLAQASRQLLDTQVANTPALLLSGQTQQIAKSFKVSQPNANEFVLTPKAADGVFERLHLTFNGKTPKGMVLVDALGQETQIDFKNVKLNTAIADQLFKFTPPKGVDIIDQ